MIIVVVVYSVDICPAAAVPHFRKLKALCDHSVHQHESDLASSDGSLSEASDQPRALKTDHVVVNYGPAKAKCVHATIFLVTKN